MSEANVGREYHQFHDSFEEMFAFCTQRLAVNAGSARSIKDSFKNSKSWFGGAESGEAMLDLISNGWPAYADQVRRTSMQLNATMELSTVEAMMIDVRRRKRRRGDQGDTLDMQRVWNGELDKAWERPVRTPRRAPSQRYATVFIDIGALGSRNAYDGIWRAACAMRVCDLLTTAGLSTEI
jgi:hypothetical protein